MDRKGLHIGDGLTLPLEAVTQAIGILAKRRAGKSYCARRIAEQLLKAGEQIIITDPKGDWHGLRSSADGKKPGFPVIIFGGEHGDVPLEVGSGELIANFAVEKRTSFLLDLSVFRKHEVATFMTAFLENLYRLKAKEVYRTPAMLIIDEADAIAPQKPQKGEERMLGAAEDIVRRGGQRGIGCMLITQRSAVLNKNVLTQINMLVALRTIAPQDLDAMKAWIDVHGTIEQQKTLMASLPSLPIGDAWFWSPGWPDAEGIFKRIHVGRIETFDSGATPKPGEKRVEPKNSAEIDIEALRHSMAETVKRAEDNNPAKLKKRVVELERQLAGAKSSGTVPERVAAQIAELKAEVDQWKQRHDLCDRNRANAVRVNKHLVAQIRQRLTGLSDFLGSIEDEIERDDQELKELPVPTLRTTGRRVVTIEEATRDLESRLPGRSIPLPEGLTAPHKKILDTLGRLESLGFTSPKVPVVAAMAGYAHRGGAWNNYKGRLNSLGLISVSAGVMCLTDEGRKLATIDGEAPTLEQLHENWLSLYAAPIQKMLRVVIEIYPRSISKEDLGARTDYEPKGGAFNNYLGRLRATGAVVNDGGGKVKASDLVFPEGLS